MVWSVMSRFLLLCDVFRLRLLRGNERRHASPSLTRASTDRFVYALVVETAAAWQERQAEIPGMGEGEMLPPGVLGIPHLNQRHVIRAACLSQHIEAGGALLGPASSPDLTTGEAGSRARPPLYVAAPVLSLGRNDLSWGFLVP
jgi:hypothetical protein